MSTFSANTPLAVRRAIVRQGPQEQVQPNLQRLAVANLQNQTGGPPLSQTLPRIDRAIAGGTTVPRLRQQNLDNRQAIANTSLTRAQARQVGGENQTRRFEATQPVRAARQGRLGQEAVAASGVLQQGLIGQASRDVAGIEAGAQREGFASTERIANVQAQITRDKGFADSVRGLLQTQAEQALARGQIGAEVVESLSKFLSQPDLDIDDALDFMVDSGLQNLVDLSVLGIAPPTQAAATSSAPAIQQQGPSGLQGAGQAVGGFLRSAATAAPRFVAGALEGAFPTQNRVVQSPFDPSETILVDANGRLVNEQPGQPR